MTCYRSAVCLIAFAGLFGMQSLLVASEPAIAVRADEVSASRKSVTVFARNAASASADAQSKNPGWTVVSVKKINKDPKSMAYKVVLKK